jgi:Chlorophyll A-B binding protein
MKIAILVTLAAAATAFAPAAKQSSASSSLKATYESEVGVITPTGFFDPFRLSAGKDQATFDQYRACEVKHGRVAQLCVVGYVVPEFYRFPGEIAPGLKFADIPNGIAAINAVPALGWFQILFLVGAVDYYGLLSYDVGKPILGAETLAKRQLQELQNGRLAMLATMELFRHDSQNLVSPGFDGLDNLITGLPFLY